ncbi:MULTISPECIES: hypothetical protein [Polaromonas]|uniref:Uncharacterized protein n=1 Tax=Polaromonas aquatica TaxID=332657 RepID=A0ABW1TU51_9BURK
MGEAKRRGTEAERIQHAHENRHAGMLHLSVAITGTEIDLDSIQILDPEPFGKITEWMMQGMGEALRTKRLNLDLFISKAWKQEDGSLIVRLIHKTAINDEFRIPKDKWQMATPEALNRAGMKLNTPEGAELLKELGKLAKEMETQPPAPTPRDVDELLDCVFMVIGREPAGLHFLSAVSEDNPYLTKAADAWIAGGAKYLTIPLDRKNGMSQPQIETAGDDAALLGLIEKHISRTKDMGRAGLNIVGVDEKSQKAAFDLWADRGGNVLLRK